MPKGRGNHERDKSCCVGYNLGATKTKDGHSNTMMNRQNSPNRTKTKHFKRYLPLFWMFPSSFVSYLFTEKSSQVKHPPSSFPPSDHKSKLLHPANIYSVKRLRQKLGFPIIAEVHCSSLHLSILCPAKSELQSCFLTKEIWENLCIWRRH